MKVTVLDKISFTVGDIDLTSLDNLGDVSYYDVLSPEEIITVCKDSDVNFVQKSISVNFLSSDISVVKVSANIEKTNENLIELKCLSGGREVCSQSLESGDNSFEFNLLNESGVQVLTFEFNSLSKFSLRKLKVEVKGYVERVLTGGSLSVGYNDSINVITSVYDGVLNVYSATKNSSLYKRFTIKKVHECSVIKVGQDSAHLLIVDERRNLKMLIVNLQNFSREEISLNVNAVSSACAYLNDSDEIVVLFSRLAEIYKGEFSQNGEFSYQKTGRKGIKLYAQFGVPNAVIIVDRNKSAKLIIN